MDIKPVYSDRFDPEYLSHLKQLFDIPRLKDGALYEKKTFNGVEYHRCISIDFCGVSATTLFNTDAGRKGIKPNVAELKEKVANAFKEIFDRKVLEELNNSDKNERFYLRVRFCFPYLYSDYPICLMKAEHPDIWAGLADRPVRNYFLNKPLTQGQFKHSHITIYQEASLHKIVDILRGNEDLIILGGKEKKANTIQVRFSVIPSPACTLIINNIAHCDPYLYAKVEKEEPLSVTYPLLTLNKKDPGTCKAFDSIRKHWDFLWRHDLTLFCKDATFFTPENKEGLLTLRKPDEIIGPKGSNWTHKEQRIWEKKEEIAGHPLDKTPADLDEISNWKANLNYKFGLCTTKLTDLIDDNIKVFVGMRRNFYHLKIELKEYNSPIEYLQFTENNLYCVMAHYCYALLEGKTLVLQEKISHTLTNLRKELITQLNNYDLDRPRTTTTKSKAGTTLETSKGARIFDELFTTHPVLALKLKPHQIHFDYEHKELIALAQYNTVGKGKRSCLNYSPR